MKTVKEHKEQNIIQPKKSSKMLRYINKKGPRLSKLRKVFALGPPDIETITERTFMLTTKVAIANNSE